MVERNVPCAFSFMALPDELILQTTVFLDVTSLLNMRATNQKLLRLASRNEAGWIGLCRHLWGGKVFVCQRARGEESSMKGYRLSIRDAKIRQHLTMDELCFDLDTKKGTIWSFRFKESAGPDWTSWDPWWNGDKARQMVFLRDGTVRQFIPKDNDRYDEIVLKTPSFGREVMDGVVMDPPVSMTWRFSSRPMDLPERPEGSYIRFSVGGRDVPTYVVRRSPTGNWGFLAESCWGVYTSFPMPPRPLCLRVRRRSNDEERSPLSDDASFIITNEVQWREALLYNFGATVLPEGESATEDFDRMFGQTLNARGGG